MKQIIFAMIFSMGANILWASVNVESVVIDDILIENKNYKESCEIIDAKIRQSGIEGSSYKGIIYMGPARGDVFLHVTKGKVLDIVKYFAEAANCKYVIKDNVILIYPFEQESVIINFQDELAKKMGITAENKNDIKHIQKLFNDFGIELESDAIKIVGDSIVVTSDEEKIKILNSYVCLLKYGWKISK